MESDPEFFVQRFFLVAHDIEAAALRGAVRAERADDHLAAWLDGPGDIANVGSALLHCCQKMKHCSIVPDVVRAQTEFCDCHVGNNPTNLLGRCPYSLLANVDSSLGNIQDRNVLVAAREKIVGQCGFTSTHINDCRGLTSGRSFDERKGRFQMRAIPAHLFRGPSRVDLFPMSSCIHVTLLLWLGRVCKDGTRQRADIENIWRRPYASDCFRELE